MSYDIWLEVMADLGGPEPVQVSVLDHWNYTSNCGPMWRAAGADLAEFDGRTAGECLPALIAAVADMRADPAKYQAMNPANGWGSYDTLMPRLDELVEAFTKAPIGIVRVSR